jgi:hypothetical protein
VCAGPCWPKPHLHVYPSRQGKATYAAPRDLIARHAGVSIRTVMAANAELAAAGLILIERHFDAERKRHDVSTYILCSLRPPGSGNICLTPQANDRSLHLPTLKANSTLKESGINEQAAPAPGAHPASADAGPGGTRGSRRTTAPHPQHMVTSSSTGANLVRRPERNEEGVL